MARRRKKKRFPDLTAHATRNVSGPDLVPSVQYPPPWYPAVKKPDGAPAFEYNPRRPKQVFYPPGPVDATVRCDGELHTVRWQNGRLVLMDHMKKGRLGLYGAESAMAILGGRCRCYAVLTAWAAGDRGKIPNALLPTYMFTAEAAKSWRRRAWAMSSIANRDTKGLNGMGDMLFKAHGDAYLAVDAATAGATAYDETDDANRRQTIYQIYARMPNFTLDDSNPALWTIRMTKFAKVTVTNHDRSDTSVDPEGVYLVRRNRKEMTAPYNHQRLIQKIRKESVGPVMWHTTTRHVTVALKPSWSVKVAAAGLSVVDGHMILDVLHKATVTDRACRSNDPRTTDMWWLAFGERPDMSAGPYVLALRKTADKTLKAWPARVVAGRLEFVGDERGTGKVR